MAAAVERLAFESLSVEILAAAAAKAQRLLVRGGRADRIGKALSASLTT